MRHCNCAVHVNRPISLNNGFKKCLVKLFFLCNNIKYTQVLLYCRLFIPLFSGYHCSISELNQKKKKIHSPKFSASHCINLGDVLVNGVRVRTMQNHENILIIALDDYLFK